MTTRYDDTQHVLLSDNDIWAVLNFLKDRGLSPFLAYLTLIAAARELGKANCIPIEEQVKAFSEMERVKVHEGPIQ
jgi:hypothetical protein